MKPSRPAARGKGTPRGTDAARGKGAPRGADADRGKGTPRGQGAAWPLPEKELLAAGLAALGWPGASGSAGLVPGVAPASMSDPARDALVRPASGLMPLLERYIAEISLFNSKFDLVGTATYGDLVVRHILDSLAPWREIADCMLSAGGQPAVADVGSGAGLPGLPLAAAFPQARFTLIERMSRRCAFLTNSAAMMGLQNVTVLESEAERAPQAAFDLIVFRAFRPLDGAMYRTLTALLAPGGCLAAWKAKRDKIDAEMAALEGLCGPWRVEETPVPFLSDEQRHLVVIGPV